MEARVPADYDKHRRREGARSMVCTRGLTFTPLGAGPQARASVAHTR